MKKICFLSGDITRSGGTEKVGCQIMNGLCEIYQVYVLSLTEQSESPFYLMNDEIIRQKLFDIQPDGKKQYFQIVKKIRRFINEHHIDILIDIDTILDMFSVIAIKGTNTKLIAWEHFNFYETMGNKMRVPIRRYMTLKADAVVTLTKEDQATYRSIFGDKTRVEQIYNPITFADAPLQYHVASKNIISVGRLANQKGFDYLIDVAALVFQKHPDWEWLILGEGDERSALEQMIAEKEIHQVKLLGRVNNVSDYLKNSACFVLTSRYEGFPLVLIEAKAHHLPIVSFKCKTGPSELVTDNINGYLIDCFDIDAMAARICDLIENPSRRIDFSDKALLDTEKMKFVNIIEQWSELIESITGGR